MHTPSHKLRSGLLMVSFCLSNVAWSQEEGAATPRTDDSLSEQVSDFLQYFIDPQKTAEEQAELFAAQAQYYDQGRVGHAAIIRDIEYFTRRWPQRNYRLSTIHYITPDPASDRVFVSYEISYRVASRNKTVSGKAQYGAVIADLGTAPKIEWIKEKVGKKNS